MEVSLLNVRITFQKNAVEVDSIGTTKHMGRLLFLPCYSKR